MFEILVKKYKNTYKSFTMMNNLKGMFLISWEKNHQDYCTSFMVSCIRFLDASTSSTFTFTCW